MTLYMHATPATNEPVDQIVGWRWLHGVEGGRMPPAGMPEIVPPIEVRKLEMTEVIQWIAYRLELRLNRYFTTKRYRAGHTWDRAMNNGKKNGYNADIALRDYPNGRDLNAASNPSYDKMQRGFGGSFFQGVDLGDQVRCDPGVHGLDARSLKRDLSDFTDFTEMLMYVERLVDEIVAQRWFVFGVSIDRIDFSIISHFPQGVFPTDDGSIYYGPVAYPFLFDRPIYFHKYDCTEWIDTKYPDPLRIYKPLTSSLWRTSESD